jgi:hypothetical protein
MVAGKNRDGDALQPRQLAPLPARQPRRKRFEPAKTSRRLGQPPLPVGGSFRCARVAVRQIATECADVV